MAAKSKLKKAGSKQMATDIQIAAGMTTLALLSNPPGQAAQQQSSPQGAPAPQQQQQAGGPAQGQQQGGQQLPPGLQAIAQVLQGANDPAAALAHVVFMAISKVEQMLESKGIQIDDKVWIMGGGVLDRVMFELMMALNSILQYPPAKDPNFVHQVKGDILDLMEKDDQNTEAMKVLHQKGLPMPKAPMSDSQQQQAGLAAPQAPAGGQQ